MSRPPASDPFRLPRLSRARTRPQDTARWSQLLAELAFAALIVLAMAGPWMNDAGTEQLRVIREVGYAAVLIAALVAIRPWRHPERLLVVPWPLLLALGWCWLSLTWAIDPGVGLRRLVLTTIVIWSLFALVREVGLDRSVAILRVLLTLLLVVNFVAVLVYPTIGIHGAGESGLTGDWRGVMAQKNYAGFSSAVTMLVFAFNAGQTPLPARLSVIAAAVAFLVLSDSATSMGVAVLALAVGGLFAWRSARDGQGRLAAPEWAWLPLGLAALLVASVALNPAFYLGLLSDPAAFTGRTQIWSALVRAYADRPLSGVGYGSLWDLGPDGPLSSYTRGWVLDQSQGHEGYLDMLAQIGAPGTLLVLFATLMWPLQRLLRGGNHSARTLGAALLLFCLGHNFTESTLFDRDALGQVFLMIAIALLWTTTAASDVRPVHEDGAPGRKRRRRSAVEPA